MQAQHAEKQVSKQSQHKKESIIIDRQIACQDIFAGIPDTLTGSVTKASVQAQAAHLNDPRFLAAQRQAMAIQIERVQGNLHLQRVMGALLSAKKDEANSALSAKIQRSHPAGHPGIPAMSMGGYMRRFLPPSLWQMPAPPMTHNGRLVMRQATADENKADGYLKVEDTAKLASQAEYLKYEASADSLFESEKAQPEDAEDVVGLAAPIASTHDEVIGLRRRYGAPGVGRTLVYGFTAWSPSRSAKFPGLTIALRPSGAKWIGVVQRTTANMGAMIACYVKAGTYQIPGAMRTAQGPQCGPAGKNVPLFSKVSVAMSQLAKMAEQEHCNDYQRAFALSFQRWADLINAKAGRRYGPNNMNAVKAQIRSETGGRTAREWMQELNRLTRLSNTRDAADHLINPFGDPKTCPADCSKLVYTTVNSPTTRIPGTSSRDLIR